MPPCFRRFGNEVLAYRPLVPLNCTSGRMVTREQSSEEAGTTMSEINLKKLVPASKMRGDRRVADPSLPLLRALLSRPGGTSPGAPGVAPGYTESASFLRRIRLFQRITPLGAPWFTVFEPWVFAAISPALR